MKRSCANIVQKPDTWRLSFSKLRRESGRLLPVRRFSLVLWWFTLVVLLSPLASGEVDHVSLAIQAVRTRMSGCEQCVFFAVPAKSSLVRLHKLYFVSTLDRMPPPYWTVGINQKNKIFVLEAEEHAGWNGMIKEERLRLRTDADFNHLARTFLDLAVGRALYVERLTASEKARVDRQLGHRPWKSFRVVRPSKGETRYRLHFYSKDPGGLLQLWDLIVLSNGQIIKAQARPF